MRALADGGPLTGRRIVFLNWRDARHPQAGGAELFCHAVAERFAAAGAEVSLVTSRPPGAARREVLDGVDVRRGGGTFTVYPAALLWLALRRRRIDAIVDCQNGIPFFSPLAVSRRTAIVCVFHHVHQEQFVRHFGWPLSRIGQLLEGPVSRRVYGRLPLAAVSPSTRADVRRTLGLRGPLHVVPNGMEVRDGRALGERSPAPRIVCVGRLVPHKRLELLIDATPRLLRAFPTLTVELVGDGPDRERLAARVAELGLGEVVTLHGRVPDEVRDRLLASAWLTVNPSAQEGWGLSVLEANACGVPAVAFRVPGLRDAVRHEVTGWLVDEGADLAPAVASALARLADPVDGRAYAERCRRWAAGFSWDSTAERLAGVVLAELDRLPRAAHGERRRVSDLVIRADVPGSALASVDAGVRRRTDVWRFDEHGVSALLYGADEAGARLALARAGLAGEARVAVARPIDLLAAGGAGGAA